MPEAKPGTAVPVMADKLAELQRQFAAHIRNPEKHPAPGDVEDRRMGIYRGLFFRNLSNFLASNFPVLRTLYTDQAWARLVREFFTEHRARTPLFPEIAREFLQYVQEQRQGREGDPPFLLELAHYEWVELALDLDETDLDALDVDPGGDLLAGVPVLSPLAWPLSYRWPVHRIRAKYQPTSAPEEATHLMVYRDRSDTVRFMRMNPVTMLLVKTLKEDKGLSGQDVLKAVADTLQHPDPSKVLRGGADLLEDLRERDVVLGTRS